MSEQLKIITFQMPHDEFYFLGKEYPRDWHTKGMDVWQDFNDSGGWDMVTKYRKNPAYTCQVVNHLLEPNGVYMTGTFVENMTEVPKGFVLGKFPAHEYLVVTHEWHTDWNLMIVEEAAKNVQIPDGYVSCQAEDGSGCQIRLIEVEHKDPEKGSRWENWLPIMKENGTIIRK